MPKILKRRDGELYYEVDGEGPVVVLIHGVGSNLNAWDGTLARLPQKRRYVRVDLRGHGRSARVPGPYTLAGMAGDVMDLVEEIGLDRFALVGFSLGGLIAQRIALDHPTRLSALALLSTIAGRTEDERLRVLDRRNTLIAKGPLTHLANAVERWFTPEFITANPSLIEARRRAAMENDPGCYMAAYDVLAASDLGDEIVRIATPTLVMTGEHDIGSNTRMAKLMHERIRGSELKILPNLKHSILLEAPDLVAEQIDAFLTRTELSQSERDSLDA